jgi:hypothetical protein
MNPLKSIWLAIVLLANEYIMMLSPIVFLMLTIFTIFTVFNIEVITGRESKHTFDIGFTSIKLVLAVALIIRSIDTREFLVCFMLYAIPLTAFTIKLVDLITNKRIMNTVLNLTNDGETEEEEEKEKSKALFYRSMDCSLLFLYPIYVFSLNLNTAFLNYLIFVLVMFASLLFIVYRVFKVNNLKVNNLTVNNIPLIFWATLSPFIALVILYFLSFIMILVNRQIFINPMFYLNTGNVQIAFKVVIFCLYCVGYMAS